MNHTLIHTVKDVKSLPAPSVRRLLREAGWTMSDVARRRGIDPSGVSRAVRKQATSERIWHDIVWLLNHPRKNGGRA